MSMPQSDASYCLRAVGLIAALTVLGLAAVWLWAGDGPLAFWAVGIAAVFQLMATTAYSLGWTKVLRVSPASMPTFYMAASAIRMFAAVATVIIYCLVTDDHRAVAFFVIVFMAFYFVLLVYDTYYYIKAEKRLNKK